YFNFGAFVRFMGVLIPIAVAEGSTWLFVRNNHLVFALVGALVLVVVYVIMRYILGDKPLQKPLFAAPAALDESKRLYRAWLGGMLDRKVLMDEARQQGYIGFAYEGKQKSPLTGQTEIPAWSPGFDLGFIVD